MARSVRLNVVANFAGTGWSALMGFIFVPLYISYLGIEAYGLIGLFAVLQAWLLALDMGLSPTLNREMARLGGGRNTAQGIRDLLRSIEIIYLAGALVIVVLVLAASNWLAQYWLSPKTMSVGDVVQALAITGVVIAFRWVGGLYRSAIAGLQEQVWLNASNIVFSTMRGAGVVAVLAFVSPTIGAFFIYQGVVAALELAFLGWLLYRLLPAADRPGRFSVSALKSVGRYAGGVAGITTLALVLTQMDKMLLSGLLPLGDFGYYALASAVAGALVAFVSPISVAIGPKLAELVARGDYPNLTARYHRYAQLMSIAVIPPALTVAVFSDRVLMLWTQDPAIVATVAPLASILILGTMVNGWMSVPYLLQLATGWTRFGLLANVIAMVVLVPALLLVVPSYGSWGAAAVWLTLNVGYVVIGLPLMHRRLLRGELGRWLLLDVGLPLICVVMVLVAWRAAAASIAAADIVGNAFVVAVAALLSLTAVVLSTESGRSVGATIGLQVLGKSG